jgi:hypothetical protein
MAEIGENDHRGAAQKEKYSFAWLLARPVSSSKWRSDVI